MTVLGAAARAQSVTLFRGALTRLLLFALLWWLLSGGAADSWYVGGVIVLLVTLLSVTLAPPQPWSLGGVLRFIPFFIRQSIGGGVDVARRALSPAMPLRPAIIDYRLSLSLPRSRLFMAAVISLLPGTLCADLQQQRLRVHVLDRGYDVQRELAQLEYYVAAIFREEISPPGRAS